VIAEGKSKQPDANISERIAYSINQFGPRVAQTKTSADSFRIDQGLGNLLDGIGGRLEVRVQEPEHFSPGDCGARVHLRRAALRRGDDTVGLAFGHSRGAIGTSTVHDDDLERRPREGSRAPEKIVDQWRFI
jgi:hypothetical protein